VIINSALSKEQEKELIKVLQKHQDAIVWTVADLKGINPSMCMRKILLEDDAKPSIQPQRNVILLEDDAMLVLLTPVVTWIQGVLGH